MRLRQAFTLVEVVAATAIASIIMMACVSVTILAGKAVPNPADQATCAISAAQVADQMTGELETALLILQQSPTSICFTVPPRNGDTSPERITYSWAGTSGAPLMRQYDNSTAAAILGSVDQFNLTPLVRTGTEAYPGIGVEDSTESLLIDYSQTNGLNSVNVDTTHFQGQCFGCTSWGPGIIGWRPTRVQFQAKQGTLLGITQTQLYMAGSGFTPIGSVLEQYSLAGTGLLSSFAWQSTTFSTIGRLAPNTGACLVLQGTLGSPSLIAQTNNSPGLIQTPNAGSSWTYSGNTAIQSRLYGKLTRSNTTQYAVSTYLTAMQLLLRAGPATNPSVQTTAQTFNHPELLSAYWEANFSTDPTQLDVNADGVKDWIVDSGAAFTPANISTGVWQPNGQQLDSQPGNNFSHVTIVDLTLRALTTGSWAGFTINAARSGSTCAPIIGQIALQSDGSQTLTLWRKTSDSTQDPLLIIGGFSAQPVALHLVIDPNYGTVGLCVNSLEYGAFAYSAYSSSNISQSLCLTSSGSAEFRYVRVRELQH